MEEKKLPVMLSIRGEQYFDDVDPDETELMTEGTMTLEEGQQHTSLYETPFGELSVDIQTSRLLHNLTERGGLMEIKYSIAVEHTVTGRNCFKIRVRPKK